MKKIAPFILLLAGCTTGQMDDPNTQPTAGTDTCNAAAYEGLIGKGAASALAVPEPKRIYGVNDPVTLDYDASRVNIQLDETDTIFAVTCG